MYKKLLIIFSVLLSLYSVNDRICAGQAYCVCNDGTIQTANNIHVGVEYKAMCNILCYNHGGVKSADLR